MFTVKVTLLIVERLRSCRSWCWLLALSLFLLACSQNPIETPEPRSTNESGTLSPVQEITVTTGTPTPITAFQETGAVAANTREPTPTQIPLPTLEITVSPLPTDIPLTIENNGATMVLVRHDFFKMGVDPTTLSAECERIERECDQNVVEPSAPAHTVFLDPYYIDMYEVTNLEFIKFLNQLGTYEGACLGENCLILEDSAIELDESRFRVSAMLRLHPVYSVTWYGAAAFCQWRGARLPTEAEWEIAASWDPESGAKFLYPWGNTFNGDLVNYCDRNCDEQEADPEFDDGYVTTAPVGSYGDGRSPVGAYDMVGNVWEWVADYFNPEYYAESPVLNPQGPLSGDVRVVRGGSWFDPSNFTNTIIRTGIPPDLTDNNIGFRCAMSLYR